MSEPFLGEIRVVGFNFAPRTWATCDGQLLPISQNTALFSLLGTYYGGNGQTNFALPNLQGRAPMAHGQGPGLTDRAIGESSGTANVTLLQSEMPSHTHLVNAQPSRADRANANLSALAASADSIYSSTGTGMVLDPTSVGLAGGSQPHNNMQPYLTLNFVIAMAGIFPARN